MVDALRFVGEPVPSCASWRRRAGPVVVVGHPGYYPRFGFAPGAAFGVVDRFGVPPGGVGGPPPAGPHAGGARPREGRRSVLTRRVGALHPADASPSCPRCGAACPARAARGRRCGFAFLDAGERRRLPRPGGRVQRVRGRTAGALALAALAAVATIVSIADEDAPPPAATPVPVLPPPPTPISALEAERRLELHFGGASDDQTAAVRCPHRIEPERRTRCELRYRNTAPRAILVRLSPRGQLDADVPDPATLKR